MRPGEAEAPSPREALSFALGSQVTPPRLSRPCGATLHAEREGQSVGVVLADRVHVGRPRGSAPSGEPLVSPGAQAGHRQVWECPETGGMRAEAI
jgi:hypothetical protein